MDIIKRESFSYRRHKYNKEFENLNSKLITYHSKLIIDDFHIRMLIHELFDIPGRDGGIEAFELP